MNFYGYLKQLRLYLKAEDYILNEKVFEKVKHFFLLCDENPQYIEKLRQ